jgi:hypothetical protein
MDIVVGLVYGRHEYCLVARLIIHVDEKTTGWVLTPRESVIASFVGGGIEKPPLITRYFFCCNTDKDTAASRVVKHSCWRGLIY